MNKVVITSLTIILGLMVLASACKPKAAPAPPAPAAAPAAKAAPPGWDKVVEGARKEGKLTIYSTFSVPGFQTGFNKAVKDKFGIEIEWVVNPGAVNAEKLRVEQAAGKPVGDIYHGGYGATIPLVEAGFLVDYRPPIIDMEPGVWVRDLFPYVKEYVATHQPPIHPLVVNTKLLKPEEYPKRYTDLLDPKWKGKMNIHDPTIMGIGSAQFMMMMEKEGIGYWEKMAKQELRLIRSYAESIRRVAVGEDYLTLLALPSMVEEYLAQGASIKPLAMEDTNFQTIYGMHLMKNAPNTNAAKVVINYLLSKEGQEFVYLLGEKPIRKDVPFKGHPLLVEATNNMKVVWFVTLERIAKMRGEVVGDSGAAAKALGKPR